VSDLYERSNQLVFHPTDYLALEHDQSGPLGLRFTKGAEMHREGSDYTLVPQPSARPPEVALYASYYAHASARRVTLYTVVGACIADREAELPPLIMQDQSRVLPRLDYVATDSLDAYFSYSPTLHDRVRTLTLAAKFLAHYNVLLSREPLHWDRSHGDYFEE